MHYHQSLVEERLLDPRSWLEGSYKVASVCPSFCSFFFPSVRFLAIGPLVFSETKDNVRGPYIVVCDSRISWKKSPSDKNGQKCPKNMVFGPFKKIASLVFSGICVKSKFLWFINNCMLGKTLVIKLKTKMALGL